MESVRLPVIHRDPVGVDFGASVRAARIKRGRLALGCLDDLAVHLARRGLVKTRANPGLADGFEQAHGARGGDVGRVLGTVETDADMALGGEIVNFLGLDMPDQAGQSAGVAQIAVVQVQMRPSNVGIGIDRIEPAGVESAGAADDAMDLVAFAQQELSEVRTVLAGDACDQRLLHCIVREGRGGRYVGASVRRCVSASVAGASVGGTSVRRYVGASVRRCVGASVRRCVGASVRRCASKHTGRQFLLVIVILCVLCGSVVQFGTVTVIEGNSPQRRRAHREDPNPQRT
ncbi:MAG: hypothetical protein BWX48_00138 [Verrucomicrobia bacterium ADurb.Bin006]|nr:MAG: hypothetical protein BWX48_00138 [Verrucomicrobia bacterium ADurb.Bin006]